MLEVKDFGKGVLIGVIYIYLRRAHSRFTPYDVKQLPTLPFIGNVLPLILRKMHFVEDLSRYYDSFPEERFIGKYEFTNPVIIVRDLELIKKVTIKDFEYFLDHRAFTDETVEPIFARNLFSLRGDEWKDMRSTLSPAFTSSKIRVMVPFMEEVGNQMMAALKKQIKANGGQPVEIDCRDLTRRYANDVIASCAFGLKVDSHADGDTQFFEMGRNAAEFKMRQMIMFLAYSAFPTFVKWIKITLFTKETTSFFRSLVIDTMRNREAHNILRPDMIHLLMEAKKGHLNHDENSKERDAGFATVEESAVGKKHIIRTWSDNDLIAQAVLFFIAGFETVSSAMSFAIRELALNKDIQDRLAKNIREDFNKNNGKIDYTSIQNLPYLDQVFSEVLRLWTPGFQLDRICTKPYNLGKPNKNGQKEYIIMLLLIWTGVLIAVIYIYIRRIHSRFTTYDVKQLPPLPFIGNVLPLVLRKIHFIEDLSRYYDSFPEERFVGKYEFTNPVIIVRDLELIKKITIKDFDYFVDHRAFTDEKVEPIFARNLFTLRGDEWKDMRSTLSPAFTSSKIRVMVPFMEEVGNQMMAVLKKQTKANGGKPVEIDCRDLTRRYANDVIATCAFGLKVDSYTEGDTKFFEMGKNAAQFKMRQMIMFFAYSAFPALVKCMKMTLFTKETTSFFRSLVIDTMRNREAHNILRPDMIHLLMEAKKGQLTHDEKSKERDAGFATVEESAVGKRQINRTWSDNDLIAQAVLFFIAGFEGISAAMSFALRELALHKDIQDQLAKHVREDSKRNNGKIDYTSIQNLPYLDKVVSEVLRLWTPGFQLDRICTKPYNLGRANNNTEKEYILQKGDQIIIPVWCLHRNPEFFPDPEKFDPERFADDKKDLIKPMTYMPFGVGPRNCIGSRFALLEIKMLIYQILLHMEVLPSEKTVLNPVFSKDTFNLNLEGGFWLNFKIRE